MLKMFYKAASEIGISIIEQYQSICLDFFHRWYLSENLLNGEEARAEGFCYGIELIKSLC